MNYLKISVILLLGFSAITLGAQQVIISEDANPSGHPSAILDIQSDDKGLLIPRVTTAVRDTMNSAPDGMLVFDTDLGALFCKSGGAWEKLEMPNNVFEKVVDTIRQTQGYLNSDFVIGSPTLDHQDNPDYYNRLFFDKSKAAFRVGFEYGNEWKDDSIGIHSFAAGSLSRASGSASTAFGSDTRAVGDYSTALGTGTLASGNQSLSYGSSSKASGNYSTAGGWLTEASGEASVAFGESSKASNLHSFAAGKSSIASGVQSTAFGNSTTASGAVSTAFGTSTQAIGESSVAFGNESQANGLNSASFGFQSIASGDQSFAGGNQSIASGINSFAHGENAKATGDHSFAHGFGAEANAFASSSLGFSTLANTPNATAVGTHNDPIFDPLEFCSDCPIFMVGNGLPGMPGFPPQPDIPEIRSNALTVYSSGWTALGNITPTEQLHITENMQADGKITIGSGSYSGLSSSKLDIYDGNITISEGKGLFTLNNTGTIISRVQYISQQLRFQAGTGTLPDMILTDAGRLGIGEFVDPTAKLQVGLNGDGTFALANAWNTFSDRRYKHNILPIGSALSMILNMNGRRFTWNTSGKKDIGFIAQELEEIIPEVVRTAEDGYKSVDYARINAVLVEALKEQQKMIEDLRKINDLHSHKLEEQEKKMNELNRQVRLLMKSN
ncbi:tail fiber domain-containing protein [Portibacter marinus]|uniref:tail fiber domain-containing protein n=1 Tax=Portibacter marinus TaxID=2898660 RepID=UPI001F31BBB2|nr:tail fiber domain-containing protein [Portibacter marinus]